ncbi:unnamed protein product [Chrysoparadoxa australica]
MPAGKRRLGESPTAAAAKGDDDKKKRRQLTSEEKVCVNRDRNREHARNTRLRKKAFVESLKQQVFELQTDRDKESREAQIKEVRESEEKMQRKFTVQIFLQLQCAGERDRSKWEVVLDEGCALRMPITPYRWFNKNEQVNESRVLFGIDAAITDACSWAVMAEQLGSGTVDWRTARQDGEYTRLLGTVDSTVLSVGDMLMCRFTVQTANAHRSGVKGDCSLQGMLQCKFGAHSRIVNMEMMFDVMGFMQQLLHSTGKTNAELAVPHTLEVACEPECAQARLITKAEPPFEVMHASKGFTNLMGYSLSDLEGKTLAVLPGQETCMNSLAWLTAEVQRCRCAAVPIVLDTKAGEHRLCLMSAFPLCFEGSFVACMWALEPQAPGVDDSEFARIQAIRMRSSSMAPTLSAPMPAMGLSESWPPTGLMPMQQALTGHQQLRCGLREKKEGDDSCKAKTPGDEGEREQFVPVMNPASQAGMGVMSMMNRVPGVMQPELESNLSFPMAPMPGMAPMPWLGNNAPVPMTNMQMGGASVLPTAPTQAPSTPVLGPAMTRVQQVQLPGQQFPTFDISGFDLAAILGTSQGNQTPLHGAI